MYGFGKFIRTKRLEAGLSLRRFCAEAQIDPSNWSKVERGRMPPRTDSAFLASLAALCRIESGSSAWHLLHDLAALEQGRIPDAVYRDEEILSALPIFFRSARGAKPSKEDLQKVVSILKRR